MGWETYVSRIITADSPAVWSVITDFSSYSEWNPTLVRATGAAEIGERLRFHLVLPGGVRVPFRARVSVVEEERELRWRGSIKGVITTEHAIQIEELTADTEGERVRVVQRERLDGALALPGMGVLGSTVREGIEDMNAALANRVERLSETED